MENTQKYKYHCRPGYGSAELLIEVFNGAGDNSFGVDLFDAIGEIHPHAAGCEDLWLNDQRLCKIQSGCGPFEISKDVWGFVFILAGKNQDCNTPDSLHCDTIFYNKLQGLVGISMSDGN